MDKFLFDHLEEYLAGQLGDRQRRQFEERLERRPADRRVIERMAAMRGMFGAFCLPPGSEPGPSPGFHARVLQQVRDQRPVPFWEFMTQPLLLRRAALVACGWLLAVGGAGLYQASAQPRPTDMARAVLALPPESADYCNVRLGCDIELNRSTMLAVVMELRAGH